MFFSNKYVMNIRVGFWKSEEEQFLPMPTQGNSFSKKGQFLNWFNELLKKCEIDVYRGSSRCRICGEDVGNKEYVFKMYMKPKPIFLYIPGGYMHYIYKHKITPPLEFFEAFKTKDIDAMKRCFKYEDNRFFYVW